MINLRFGAMYPPIEKQLNDVGFTLGKDELRIENIRNAILTVGFYVATEKQTDKMFKRLVKLIEEKSAPIEEKSAPIEEGM